MEEQKYYEHHLKLCVYVFYERIVKNGNGNGCGTMGMDVVQVIYVRSISIHKVPYNFHIEILHIEAAHFDLRVPINAHNILAPPQLTRVIPLSILDGPPQQLTSVSDCLLY